VSSSWLLKTRQMSEAGKEIILTEALATHMRTPRDRQLVMSTHDEKYPLDDIFAFFGSFYLYNYQGLRLLHIDTSENLSIEEMQAQTKKERDLLETEVRMLLGNRYREEIDVGRISSSFMVEACSTVRQTTSDPEHLREQVIALVKKYAQMIPAEYSPNSEVDFINEITAWGPKWRKEMYVKASGLKEASLSLRDELLRSHEEEIAESTVLKKGIKSVTGTYQPLASRVLTDELQVEHWNSIASAIISNIHDAEMSIDAIRSAHEVRISVLETLKGSIDNPTTLEEYEASMGQSIVQGLTSIPPEVNIFEALSCFVGMSLDDTTAFLRANGIVTPTSVVPGLKASLDQSEKDTDAQSTEAPAHTQEELEGITKDLRRLEKIEHTLEKPVKGMLKAKGLRAAELDRITIDFLTKDRSTLLGFEIQVFEELDNKVRVPEPAEISRLLALRENFKSGSLTGVEMSTSSDLGRQIQHGKSMATLRMDLVWFFTIGVLKNLARVVETYIRSKHDIQRSKTILKSIYEDSDTQLQFLREEILIDLLSMRLSEMKTIHPELDASTVCSWYHARLTNKDLGTARKHLSSSVSPVFAGIVDQPLDLSSLSFDNYAIAFDLMQRFLNEQRRERDIRVEIVAEAKKAEQRRIDEKRSGLDVMNFIYTKAHTVFRAIGRVGAKGLEWNANDDAKCANLLAFFLKTSRARPICSVCGEISDEGKCSTHGKGQMNDSNDIDNLSWFVMRAITDIKEGLLGAKAEPVSWSDARSIVQREIGILRRRGKLTSKTNLKAMMPGEINYIVGPAIASVIGNYFNESLEYAARRAGIA
jgi:hypothetical protein